MEINTDNIDKFGHCCKCHRNLLIKRVVSGKVIDMFAPEFDQTEFLMNNGSRLVVCLCKICQNSYDLSDPKIHQQIMEAVHKGWLLEDKLQVDAGQMKPETAKEHQEQRREWTIELHSRGISDEVIRERQNKVKKMIQDNIEAVK